MPPSTVNRVQVEIVGRDVSGGKTLADLGTQAQATERRLVSLQGGVKDYRSAISSAGAATTAMSGALGVAGSRVGALASSLSGALATGGPWGLLIAGAATAATLFADELGRSGEEAEKSKKKVVDALDAERKAINDAIDATRELNREYAARQSGRDPAVASAADAAVAARRKQTDAERALAEVEKRLKRAEEDNQGLDRSSSAKVIKDRIAAEDALRKERDRLQGEVTKLRAQSDEAQARLNVTGKTPAEVQAEADKKKQEEKDRADAEAKRKADAAREAERKAQEAWWDQDQEQQSEYERQRAKDFKSNADVLAEFERRAAAYAIERNAAEWEQKQENYKRGVAAIKRMREKEVAASEHEREAAAQAGQQLGMSYVTSFLETLRRAKEGDSQGAIKSFLQGLFSLGGGLLGFALAGPGGAAVGAQIGGGVGGLFHTGGAVRTAHTGRYMRSGEPVYPKEGEAFLDERTTTNLGGAAGVEQLIASGGASGIGHTFHIAAPNVTIQGTADMNTARAIDAALKRYVREAPTAMARALQQVVQKQTGLNPVRT